MTAQHRQDNAGQAAGPSKLPPPHVGPPAVPQPSPAGAYPPPPGLADSDAELERLGDALLDRSIVGLPGDPRPVTAVINALDQLRDELLLGDAARMVQDRAADLRHDETLRGRLTVEQDIRARALEAAAGLLAGCGLDDEFDTDALTDEVLQVAARFAAFIATGAGAVVPLTSSGTLDNDFPR